MAAKFYYIPDVHVFLVLVLLLTNQKIVSATISQDFNIEENLPAGSFIGKLQGQGPYVVFDGSSVSADLNIDQTNGRITTRSELDREKRDVYSFGAIPSEPGVSNEPLKVTVRVTDVNDNSPEFHKPTIRVTMSETAPKDTKPSLGSAVDRDLGQNTTQMYEITRGNVGNAFRLAWRRASNNELYCDLLVNGVLDYETTKQYNLEVTAYDGGTPRRSGTMQVVVDILDSNDNQPIFNTSRYSIKVSENATVGTSVARVFATDVDTGLNGQIRYYIDRSRSDADEVFSIDERSGVIKLNKELDYETQSAYELIVVARDSGAQPMETTAIVSVNVGDVNDHTPDIQLIFLTDDGKPRLPENTKPGDFLARISVSDKDQDGASPGVNVTLVGGGGHFALTSRDNIVYLVIVSNPIDREMKPSYELTVIVKDSGSPPLSTNRTFTVHVVDRNDNRPTFTKAVYRAAVDETALPGSSVLQVRALDLDTGNNSRISYSILENPSNHSDWFRINSQSGLITTKSRLDCETHSEPRIKIRAADHGEPSLWSEAEVVISVRDENDNPPLFDQSYYTLSLAEDSQRGACVLKVSATDPDCGVNARVTYSLSRQDTPFEIRSETGDICILHQLDYETTQRYEMVVIAKDGDGLQSTCMLKVTVTNVNDNLPVFYPAQYAVNLFPTAETGTEIAAVRATDRDNQGRLFYTISSGNSRNIFTINQYTGVIELVSPLIPGVSVYDLIVQAADSDNFLSQNTARVQISVIETSQAPPVFTSSIDLYDPCASIHQVSDNFLSQNTARVQISVIETSQAPPVFTRSLYTFTVAENIGENAAVGTVRAESSASSSVTYSLVSGDEAGYLSIERESGLLRVRRALDADTQPGLLVTIQARTGNPPRFNTAQANVSISDVNDNSPVFASQAVQLTVKESLAVNSAIYQVHATDADSGDNGLLIYSLVSGPHYSLFSLHPDSGLLTIARTLDYELATKTYQISVQARDSAPAPRIARQDITVTVEDANDNPPVFLKPAYVFTVEESTDINTKFGKIEAEDKDSGNNAKLIYSLEPENEYFAIFPNDGNLYVEKKLDRELQHQYVLNVLVQDNGSPSKSARVPVTIRVTDVNDHEPVFEKPVYQFSVSENLPAGTYIGTVLATDEDGGKNGDIKYSLNSGTSDFVISSGGQIRSVRGLDREKQSRFTLGVLARDSGSVPRSAQASVHVDVLDENDHAPVWLTAGSAEVEENMPAHTRVMQLSARDDDTGANAKLVYLLDNNADSTPFLVDAQTGWITTRYPLDYEEKQSYLLTAIARDQGLALKREARHSFIIKVRDVQEGSSDSPTKRITFHVAENREVGSEIGKITGNSEDGVTTFFLVAGNDLSQFEVNMVTGDVYLVQQLDREVKNEYELEILARNSRALFSRTTTIFVHVFIADINDNRPEFESDPILISVPENKPPGTVVHTFNAQDGDNGPNGTIHYRIISTSPSGDYFRVEADSGRVVTKARLKFEVVKQVSVIVEAEDRAPAGSRLQTRVTLHVFVQDVNEHAPELHVPAELELADSEAPGYPVLQVLASDRDSGPAGTVSYSMRGPAAHLFTLHPDTGLLAVAKRLSDSSQTSYSLNVTARDNGTPSLAAWRTIVIKVVVAEDEPPSFERAQYVGSVAENLSAGQSVLTLRASPGHSQGAGAEVVYRLSGSVPEFRVDAATGVLSTTASLDRETRPAYTFTAFASASSAANVASSVTVTVAVRDVNDNAPTFVHTSYTVNIPENQSEQAFYTVVAADPDSDQNGQVRYFITDGDPENAFIINLTSGEVSCDALDAETKNSYNLTITAQDMSVVGARSSRMSLLVNAVDLNDNDPVFSQTTYQTSVAEDAAVGESVLQVLATDADSAENGRVLHSLGPGTRGAFHIHPTSGIITIARSLDRERVPEYRFEVMATDGGVDSARTVRVPVTITLTDVNDNAPLFARVPYTAVVELNHPSGRHVLQVSASDADVGVHASVAYSLTSASQYFTVEAGSGVVRTKRLLDAQAVGYHTLVVLAADGGTPRLSAQGFVKITVGNPLGIGNIQFSQDIYNKTLNENSPVLSPVTQVQASFTDTGSGADITYSVVSGNYDQTYTIDRNTGWVRVSDRRGVDYEVSHTRRLVVMAEGRGASAYVSVNVNLEDRNDNPPVFTQQQYVTSVQERVEMDTLVTEVTATDQDEGRNANIRYYIITGNQDDSFRLASVTSGEVRTNSVLDREILGGYTLEIEAVDGGRIPLSSTCTVQILVVDTNDNSPFFPTPKLITVPETTPVGSTITQVTANDVDVGPPLVYSFRAGGNPGGVFGIDRFSGQIFLVTPLDYETQQSYSLEVSASDGVATAHTSLEIRARDDNDNPPRFTTDSYQTTLSSSAKPGQSVLTVRAEDADQGENARVTYSLVNSSFPSLFIDSASGVVSVSQAVPVGLRFMSVLVRARDGGQPALSALAHITIRVDDGLGPPPAFRSTLHTASLSEASSVGALLVTVNASSTEQQRLTYTISAGDPGHVFAVLRHTGQLVLTKPLDRELQPTYSLTVTARNDQTLAPRTAKTTVHVTVTDVNDKVPEFDRSTYSRSLVESTQPGSRILQVFAHDGDVGENALVDYAITSGNDGGLFTINSDSGWISLSKTLDSEKTAQHRLVVRARDCESCTKQYSLASYVLVTINVTDINEHDPKFPISDNDHPLYRTVLENSAAGTVVFTARAVDLDQPARIFYSLHNSNDFTIDSATGVVRTRSVFDYEERSVYEVTVRVRDESGAASQDEQEVEVRVVDADEYPPAFEQAEYEFVVRGDAQPGDVLGRVHANDLDGGQAGQVFYTLNPTSDYFTIDPRLGVLAVLLPLNDVRRTKRDVSGHSNTRNKRSTLKGPLREDQVKLNILATSGVPDSLTSSVEVLCSVNRTCAGCEAPRPVVSGLDNTQLILIIVFTVVIFLILLVVIVLLLLRRRLYNKKEAASPDNQQYSIFNMAAAAGGLQARTPLQSDMELPPPYVNGKHGYVNSACHQHSDLSHSSGRGSATVGLDEDIDEELHIINSSPFFSSPPNSSGMAPDSGIHDDMPDGDDRSLQVTTHQQYLIKLGIDVNKLNAEIEGSLQGTSSVHNRSRDSNSSRASFSNALDDPDIRKLIHDHVSEIERCGSPASKNHGAILDAPRVSDMIDNEEALGGSYNWDYLLDWGPQYQPMADVFNEIAKLKDESIQPRRVAAQIVPQTRPRSGGRTAAPPVVKSSYPPPMITDTPPSSVALLRDRSSDRSVGSGRTGSDVSSVRVTPRSPIVHDHSASPYLPSFTPTLTPLGLSDAHYPGAAKRYPPRSKRSSSHVAMVPLGQAGLPPSVADPRTHRPPSTSSHPPSHVSASGSEHEFRI